MSTKMLLVLIGISVTQTAAFSLNRLEHGLDNQMSAIFRRVANPPATTPLPVTAGGLSVHSSISHIQERILQYENGLIDFLSAKSARTDSTSLFQLDPQLAVKAVEAVMRPGRISSGELISNLPGRLVSLQSHMLNRLLTDSVHRNSTFLTAYWLRYGADANSADLRTGLSVLCTAVQSRSKSITQLLLERGADFRGRDPHFGTLLHLMANGTSSDWSQIGRTFLERGIGIDAVDSRGRTALHAAAASGNLWFVQFLIDQGADLEPADMNGNRPLHLSAGHDVSRILIQNGARTQPLDQWGRTPLHWAAIRDQPLVARILIHFGANVHLADEMNLTAADYARRLHLNRDIDILLSSQVLFQSKINSS